MSKQKRVRQTACSRSVEPTAAELTPEYIEMIDEAVKEEYVMYRGCVDMAMCEDEDTEDSFTDMFPELVQENCVEMVQRMAQIAHNTFSSIHGYCPNDEVVNVRLRYLLLHPMSDEEEEEVTAKAIARVKSHQEDTASKLVARNKPFPWVVGDGAVLHD